LRQRNFENKNILEFGGGQSTLWWSDHARSVLTIEPDPDWFANLRQKIGDNVRLHHVPVDRATRTILPVKKVLDANPISKFDIIIVDGHLRKELTALAFDYLAPEGAIILDNAEGYWVCDETTPKDCRRFDFFGFAPGVSLRHCTSIVFVRDCFLIKADIPIPVLEIQNS
jgi:predicted O-methyltransferase YrrM